MFWVDSVIEEVKKINKDKIEKGEPIIVRDEKTASGRVHVGSLRGVVVHGAVAKELNNKGIDAKFLFEINDFDPMDGIPSSLDQGEYKKYLGNQLYKIPSPDGSDKSFAEYYGDEFKEVISSLGFGAEFYNLSDLYLEGKFDDAIRQALDASEKIRNIYKKVSNSDKPEGWYPLNVVCESCGKISTTVVDSWDGERVHYKCNENAVDWTEGCGYEGEISPFGGNSKLPWKVEWPAKFKVLDVDIEGSGKDHATKGGSRDIADQIVKNVFDHRSPINTKYEWLNVEGRSMSSSKGVGVSAKEMADLLPVEVLNLLLLQKKPVQVIDFSPDGDSIPILFDAYDRMAQDYFDEKEEYTSEIFRLIHPEEKKNKLQKRFLPRFSQIVYLVQMPHIDIEKEIEKNEGVSLSDLDKVEIKYRSDFAKVWLEKMAPEKYKFEIQENLPEAAGGFDDEQKAALRSVLDFIKENESYTGEDFHKALHDIKNDSGIDPRKFFEAIYVSILGKDSGPKAGWFLSVLDRDFLIKRFEEV
jgi:lysyl-tRNA synthetase class 1